MLMNVSFAREQLEEQKQRDSRSEWLLNRLPLLLPTFTGLGLALSDYPSVQARLGAIVPLGWIAGWQAFGGIIWLFVSVGCSGWTAWRFARDNDSDAGGRVFITFFATGLLWIAHGVATGLAFFVLGFITRDAPWLPN